MPRLQQRVWKSVAEGLAVLLTRNVRSSSRVHMHSYMPSYRCGERGQLGGVFGRRNVYAALDRQGESGTLMLIILQRRA